MNTSPDSVFKDLIDFGLGANGAIIPENVADQLVRGFMKMPQNRYKSLTENLSDRWTDTANRLAIFFDFWRAISDEYSDVWTEAESSAKKGEQHQMFMKVALITLQRFLLDRFVTALPYRSKGAQPPFSSRETIKEMIVSTLENLPSKFFSQEWKVKQMDTTNGRELLYDEMGKTWDNAGRNIGNQKLFRG